MTIIKSDKAFVVNSSYSAIQDEMTILKHSYGQNKVGASHALLSTELEAVVVVAIEDTSAGLALVIMWLVACQPAHR